MSHTGASGDTRTGRSVAVYKNCIISIKTSKRDFSSKVTWSGASYVVWLPVKQPDLTSSGCDLQHTKPDRETQQRGGVTSTLTSLTIDYRAFMQTSNTLQRNQVNTCFHPAALPVRRSNLRAKVAFAGNFSMRLNGDKQRDPPGAKCIKTSTW